MSENLTIRHLTLKGCGHDINEDNYFVKAGIVLVADGMGGESSGEIASGIAVKVIEEKKFLLKECLRSTSKIREIMSSIVHCIDKEINRYIDSHPSAFGMGTTILLALIEDKKIYISWCGDSRAYLFNGKELLALTKDHSYVQELIDKGEITVEESFSHPDSNLITRYVGGGEGYCQPDFVTYELEPSDLLIFCSDGLTGYCKDSEIKGCIENNPKSKLINSLKELTLSKGCNDDITIITVASHESMRESNLKPSILHRLSQAFRL